MSAEGVGSSRKGVCFYFSMRLNSNRAKKTLPNILFFAQVIRGRFTEGAVWMSVNNFAKEVVILSHTNSRLRKKQYIFLI